MKDRAWLPLLGIVGALVACSSSSTEGGAGPSPAPAPASEQDPTSPPGEADADSGARDATTPASDASADAPRGSVGGCASCTAQKCMAQLQACAAAPGCVDHLKAFNDCYGRSTSGSAACGADFAKSGAAAATLWACLQAKCTTECS